MCMNKKNGKKCDCKKTCKDTKEEKKDTAKTVTIGIGIKVPEMIVRNFPKNKKVLKKSLKLLDGFHIYANRIKAFFGNDSDIAVECDYNKKLLNLVIPDTFKAECVATILKQKTDLMEENPLRINGKPLADTTKKELNPNTIRIALTGNKYVSKIKTFDFGDPNVKAAAARTFCMMRRGIIDIYDDNWGCPWGFTPMTSEQLAQDLLSLGDVWICTDYE